MKLQLQPLRHLPGAPRDVGIGGGADRPLHRARHHLAGAVDAGGVVDDLVAEERPLLHQALHGHPSLERGGRTATSGFGERVGRTGGGCPAGDFLPLTPSALRLLSAHAELAALAGSARAP